MTRRWRPDALVRALAAEVEAKPELGVEGLHLASTLGPMPGTVASSRARAARVGLFSIGAAV